MVISAHAFDFADELRASRDPELVLLKGHIGVERWLVAAVAGRLRTVEAEVPGLKFSALVDIAFKNSDDRKPFIWLNDLRNAAAHEFNALDTPQFSSVLGRFGLPWPKGPLERCIVLEQLLLRYSERAALQMLDYMRWAPLEPDDDFSEDFFAEIEIESEEMRKRIAQRDATLAKIKDEMWEELVHELRPGWQQKL